MYYFRKFVHAFKHWTNDIAAIIFYFVFIPKSRPWNHTKGSRK